MSYIIINPEFRLRGYKGLPFGLMNNDSGEVIFFSKQEYEFVLMMDGKTGIDQDKLNEAQKSVFDQLTKNKAIRVIEVPEELAAEQKYHKYPAMYKQCVHWSITGACNYRCRHCFMSAPKNVFTEPTWEQCRDAIHQMAECGIRFVELTGGEPLISPHFYKILDECKACEIAISTIYTNGSLVTGKLLDELERRNMHPHIQMSYDGIGWHDWMRGVDGAEKQVINALRLCKERGYSTSVSYSMHKDNLTVLNESIRLMESLGVKHMKCNITTPEGLWMNEREHFLDMDETNRYLMDIAIPQFIKDDLKIDVQFCLLMAWDSKEKRGSIPAVKFNGEESATKEWACGSIKHNSYLSPEGYVLPCMMMAGTAIQKQFESIYDRPLRDILTDSSYARTSLMKMGEIVDSHEECRECEYKLICGAGCRACAIGGNGTDYKAIDREVCEFFKKGWYEKAKDVLCL